jgi:hypothetical protein
MRAIAPPRGSQKPAGNVAKLASSGAHPTLASCNPTADAAAPAKAEPSKGRVLAIKLATSRRLRSAGFGSPAIARRQGRNWFRWGGGHLCQLAARRWRLTGLLLLLALTVGLRFGCYPDRGPRGRARRSGPIRLRAAGRSRRPRGRALSAAAKLAYPVHRARHRATASRSSGFPPAGDARGADVPVLMSCGHVRRHIPRRSSAVPEVSITIAGPGDRTGRLATTLAMVRAQVLPYLPAHAAIGHVADGQAAVTIEFAAPTPLGLLTPVLEADLQPAPARDRESPARPAGEGSIR